MIKGLTKYGLGNVKNLEEFVLLAEKNGFQAVDTDGDALRELVDEKGMEGAKRFLEKHNVKIGAIAFLAKWKESDEQFYSSLPGLQEDAKLAQAFDCDTFFTFFMPSTDHNPAHYLIKLTNRIRLSAKILKGYGCKLALEFVGPYHLRNKFQNGFIWDIPSTLDWIDMIGEPNVGILLDSLHWHTTGGKLEEITAMDASQIAYVHINDACDLPVEEILDNDRLYPGEGIIDLVGFLQALEEIHYDGVVSQEILTLDEPQETSEVLAKKSGEAVSDVFNKAGIS